MENLDPLAITGIMFASMLMLMALGAPLAWALTICGVGSAYAIYGDGGLDLLISSTFSAMDNFLLVALPMFIFIDRKSVV